MSSAASNYDVSRLQWGICLAAASAVAACAALVFVTRDSIVAWIIFITICLSYGGMMFASSYVEEEQHFWYWTASGWLAFLIVKECVVSHRPLPKCLADGCIKEQVAAGPNGRRGHSDHRSAVWSTYHTTLESDGPEAGR